ncbi:LPXTG cell wall anchor domain-containing protein [Spiroplasma floricola]|uniref:Uncharacterized protein n=1 Tax=Spiroplasma floricola 23-6 TaxID=1336749 RepID=A0A2K8SCP2_9MOLU|nr:LPXTG cell wall anchor domain-containing protein [Spiroplasma floricola]AUB31224.1 hypothetical protein SFLOR_v1c01630 [Spiroplasma floricola 23-6]
MSQNQIIGLSIFLIGLLIMAIFGGLIFYFRNKNKNNSIFVAKNQESQTIWEFTKKNFPVFITLFGLIMSITGAIMMF